MTQTIEQLQARIAELEAENANLLAANRDCIEHFNAMQQDLAAAQLQIETLRDACKKAEQLIKYQYTGSREAMTYLQNTGDACFEALTQPTSTEALDAYVAEKVKESTVKIADQLQQERLQSITDFGQYQEAYEQLATITRQRDLAVEALEWIASSLPQIGVERVWMLDHANKTLAAIKESEVK